MAGVEQELFRLWNFPFGRRRCANCHFCFERSVEEFALLLRGWELPDVEGPSLLREAGRGNRRPETAGRFMQRRGDGAVLWIK